KDELRAQIRETIQAAQEAQRDAAIEMSIANGQTPVPPALPGHTIQGPLFGDNVIPQQAVDIANGFFFMTAVMVVGWPLARAFGRRLEKGGRSIAVNPAMTEQLQRIEQAVDSMSVEIERISESQRFMAKLQSSQSAEPIALPASDRR
ncbi:MAG: hypothetical protein JWL95_1254, partial [Gemmatimonadetes bacterium]|nr:hypothetical protein [Gemmatimonadota bacterium]